jgi:hypothetical protein
MFLGENISPARSVRADAQQTGAKTPLTPWKYQGTGKLPTASYTIEKGVCSDEPRAAGPAEVKLEKEKDKHQKKKIQAAKKMGDVGERRGGEPFGSTLPPRPTQADS